MASAQLKFKVYLQQPVYDRDANCVNCPWGKRGFIRCVTCSDMLCEECGTAAEKCMECEHGEVDEDGRIPARMFVEVRDVVYEEEELWDDACEQKPFVPIVVDLTTEPEYIYIG